MAASQVWVALDDPSAGTFVPISVGSTSARPDLSSPGNMSWFGRLNDTNAILRAARIAWRNESHGPVGSLLFITGCLFI